MTKDFDSWHKVKKRLEAIQKPPFFNEREIWWCSVGVNIGFEVYGKGRLFTRPVLIFRKQSAYTFLGIPLSTKLKDREDYFKFEFQNKLVSAQLNEIRRFDSRRLADKLGKLSTSKYEAIQKELIRINFQPPR